MYFLTQNVAFRNATDKHNNYEVYFSATLSLLGIGYGANIHVQEVFDVFITVVFLIIGYVIHMFMFGKYVQTNNFQKIKTLLGNWNIVLKYFTYLFLHCNLVKVLAY